MTPAEREDPSGQPCAFTLRGVCLERPGAGHVLDGIDLEIPAGEMTVLIGASGSGKTSLLRLLNRLDDPSAGEIRYRGRGLREYPVRELRRRISFVFQTPVLFPGSVRDNLHVGVELAGIPEMDVSATIRRALRTAELDPGLLDRPAERLSGGEGQRVTLARALIAAPEVLLLDEPTSALDPATAERLVDTIRRMGREHGLTVVMATHRLDEARRASDRVIAMERGRIIAAGPAGALLDHTGSRRLPTLAGS